MAQEIPKQADSRKRLLSLHIIDLLDAPPTRLMDTDLAFLAHNLVVPERQPNQMEGDRKMNTATEV